MEEGKILEGKYEIVSMIKKGGFGIVYCGYDKNFDKPVAIKAIEPRLLKDAKYIDLFQEEAKNAAKLNHHNIVHIYDLIRSEDGNFYIIMEYIEGADLEKILNRCSHLKQTIPHHLAIYIVKEICKALDYVHNKRNPITNEPMNLVHQDISPSNIMISINGAVKLIDFGIARLRYGGLDGANKVTLAGKIPYLSPEQFDGNGVIDRRSDLFSLGSVFYEILTGERLFQNETVEKTIDAIQKVKLDFRPLAAARVPESIKNILAKVLQKDPDNRYQGANEMYLDLVRYLKASAKTVALSQELGNFVKELLAEGEEKSDEQFVAREEIIQETRDIETEAEKSNLHEPDKQQGEVEEIAGVDESVEPIPFGSTEVMEDEEDEEPVEIQMKERAVEEILALPRGTFKPESTADTILVETDTAQQIDSGRKKPSPEGVKKTKTGVTHLPTKKEKAIPIEETSVVISDKLIEEDKAKEPETKKPREPEASLIEETPPRPSPTPGVPRWEEAEDELKTIIDVIRLSAKSHKKTIVRSLLGILAFVFVFTLLDIAFRWTNMGQSIYDRFFPPAIKIYSVPSGAEVYMDDEKLPGKTPLAIPRIAPGIHKLKLAYPGFSPVLKSLHVPSKGDIKISGEKNRGGNEPYLFRFVTELELNSVPAGAEIYLNNLPYPEKTPCTVQWEAGLDLAIKMEKKGFERLFGFSINTVDGVEEIEDRRMWNFSRLEGETTRYRLEGIFRKRIKISSVPTGSAIYLDNAPTPVGRTGAVRELLITAGKHRMVFKKRGFLPRSVSFEVNEDGPKSIAAVLYRKVRFSAKDITDSTGKEIGATIVRIYQRGRSYRRNDKTPCEIVLSPFKQQVLVRKNGYKDAVVQILPDTRNVVVQMEPQNVFVEVIIKDAVTGLPIANAQVSYRSLATDEANEVFFGSTDATGRCEKRIPPGDYFFKAKRFGYFEKTTNFSTSSSEQNRIQFSLIIK